MYVCVENEMVRLWSDPAFVWQVQNYMKTETVRHKNEYRDAFWNLVFVGTRLLDALDTANHVKGDGFGPDKIKHDISIEERHAE